MIAHNVHLQILCTPNSGLILVGWVADCAAVDITVVCATEDNIFLLVCVFGAA